jgi:hypothetical protein
MNRLPNRPLKPKTYPCERCGVQPGVDTVLARHTASILPNWLGECHRSPRRYGFGMRQLMKMLTVKPTYTTTDLHLAALAIIS